MNNEVNDNARKSILQRACREQCKTIHQANNGIQRNEHRNAQSRPVNADNHRNIVSNWPSVLSRSRVGHLVGQHRILRNWREKTPRETKCPRAEENEMETRTFVNGIRTVVSRLIMARRAIRGILRYTMNDYIRV